jgi:hypothetical protein
MNRIFPALAMGAAILTVSLMAQPQFPPPQSQGQPAPQATQPNQDQQADPPSRVARLNWISGDVAYQPATVDTWTNATLNYPLTTGDHIFVNAGARAELHIGGSAIRLNSNSNFGFLNLNDSIVQMSFNQGSLELRLRQLDQNDSYEIDTPNGAVTLLRAGDYRVDTDPARNATMVTVRSGQAEVYQDGNSLLVTPHQTAWFHEGGSPEVNSENARDDFDAFVGTRNDAEEMLPRRDYVPESMIGSQDLYAYGHWVNDPLYGWVWAPPVNPGWTPYSTGRWAFVEPWGWTWVDEAPWGFAPFHYGRWAMLRGGWVWIPGAPSYRPVYSPALVAFVGGGGFGVSIGWFPLGPREPWIPAWGASRAYINNVNVMHVTNINVVNVTNVTYVNRQNVTVVSQADFAAARPVGAAAIRMSPAQLQGAQVLGTSPRVVPARESVVVGAVHPAPVVSARVVVAKTTPPPAPVSFQARQQLLAQNHGLPLSASQVGQLRSQQPAAVVPHAQVRAVGAPAGQPVGNAAPATNTTTANPTRPADRMSSRPPGAQPLPTPAAQSQPAAPAVQSRPAQPAVQAQPAALPAPRVTPAAQPAVQPAAPVRPANKQTKATPKGRPEEKEEKK